MSISWALLFRDQLFNIRCMAGYGWLNYTATTRSWLKNDPCAHRRWAAPHFASNIIWKNHQIVGYMGYILQIYKHHISRFVRSRFASGRFVVPLLHLAFLLETPCFTAAAARTAPPCGARASPQNGTKEPQKSRKESVVNKKLVGGLNPSEKY